MNEVHGDDLVGGRQSHLGASQAADPYRITYDPEIFAITTQQP